MKRIVMLMAALAAVALPGSAQAQDFQVVVNESVPIETISKSDLSKVFRKKVRQIGGVNASPVDLAAGSSVREAFSQGVHGRSAAAIESYWQQQIFAGEKVPPVKKTSDAEVLAYVRGTPGAVGYVAAGASLGAGVKALRVSG